MIRTPYVDKVNTGFLSWSQVLKSYKAVPAGGSPFSWEEKSRPLLNALKDGTNADYYERLTVLWSQESSKSDSVSLRTNNMAYMTALGKRTALDRRQELTFP